MVYAVKLRIGRHSAADDVTIFMPHLRLIPVFKRVIGIGIKHKHRIKRCGISLTEKANCSSVLRIGNGVRRIAWDEDFISRIREKNLTVNLHL